MWYFWTKWHWDRFFFELFAFLLSISFYRGSPCSYITRGMNSTPDGGHSSETSSHLVDMNNNIVSFLILSK
jgi:hypothetical protein